MKASIWMGAVGSLACCFAIGCGAAPEGQEDDALQGQEPSAAPQQNEPNAAQPGLEQQGPAEAIAPQAPGLQGPLAPGELGPSAVAPGALGGLPSCGATVIAIPRPAIPVIQAPRVTCRQVLPPPVRVPVLTTTTVQPPPITVPEVTVPPPAYACPQSLQVAPMSGCPIGAFGLQGMPAIAPQGAVVAPQGLQNVQAPQAPIAPQQQGL